MKKIIAVALLASGAAFASLPAMAQEQGQAVQNQGTGGHSMKVLNQMPLTLEKARNAVDSLLLLREKYKDYKFKGQSRGPMGVIEGMKNSKVRDQILADLKKYGFDSIEDWVASFVSVGLAVSYVQRNQDGKLEKKIEEIRKNPNIPDEVKQQLVNMLTALVPPKGNEEVARKLLADKDYAAKIAKLIPKHQNLTPPSGKAKKD